MSRYIDAEKVMEEINRIGGHNLCEWETIGVKALIDRQLTADVVEVVRCKDCIKKDTPKCAMWYDCEKCKGQWSWCNPNDFCSYGERRET